MLTHEELLIQTARLYYEENLTQSEIGKRLNTSRSTVSRLLQEAKDKGFVKININYPWRRNEILEQQIMELFEVREVQVLESSRRPESEVVRGVGMLAGQFLDSFVYDNMTLGVSYGRSVAAAIDQLNPQRDVNMTVVQIVGALGSGNSPIESPDLVRKFASTYNADYHYLHVPIIVESEQTQALLSQEPSVRDILQLGRKADAAIIGIGEHHGANPEEASDLILTGVLTAKDSALLKSQGAVGHMCAQHFGANGEILDVTHNRRVISIGIEALSNIETVIAVASSRNKAEAILGALHGGYLDVLIIDDLAARQVLALALGIFF